MEKEENIDSDFSSKKISCSKQKYWSLNSNLIDEKNKLLTKQLFSKKIFSMTQSKLIKQY